MVVVVTVVVRACMGACMGACVHVDGVVVYFLLLVLMVADVTESQQAIVRVTPADGMQPFTMQSKGGQEERKKGKESMGEKKNKRREADYNHK